MKKKRDDSAFLSLKTTRIMKITAIFILAGILQVSAVTYAQEHRISVEVKNGTFYEVVSQIEKQSKFMFFYKSEEIDNNQRINLNVKKMCIRDSIWSLKDELRFSDRREIEEAYNRFTLSLGKSKNAKPHFYIYPILKYVAAVIIIGLLGLNLYKMVQPATVGENTVEVPKGQRASLMLSDGTKIWLNSQSKLIYPTQFSDKERNVRLEGEAFFDVAHKEHLPFVVHSPLLAIRCV